MFKHTEALWSSNSHKNQKCYIYPNTSVCSFLHLLTNLKIIVKGTKAMEYGKNISPETDIGETNIHMQSEGGYSPYTIYKR